MIRSLGANSRSFISSTAYLKKKIEIMENWQIYAKKLKNQTIGLENGLCYNSELECRENEREAIIQYNNQKKTREFT